MIYLKDQIVVKASDIRNSLRFVNNPFYIIN